MSAQTTNDEAAAWAVRLDGGPLSADEERELKAWLQASPGHQGALVRARAVWASIGAPATARTTTSSAPALSTGAAPAVPSIPQTQRRFRTGWIRGAAAMLTAAAVLVLGYRALPGHGDTYATGVGEVRRIALEDGSAITLNSNSAAVVEFAKDRRSVRLERGEGLFEVAKNPARPFIVSTGGVSVRAVGTAFAVRALTDAVTVTVTEGVVEVTRQDETPQRVTVNQRAEVRRHRAVTVRAEDPAETTRQLAWREGVLSFSGEPLSEAVAEVNRYSRRQVEVADPKLAAKPVIGIFRAGDVEGFAEATAAALGAESRIEGDVIRLTPSATP